MAWTIEVNHTADKDLKKLDKTARQQVLKYLNEKVAPILANSENH
ncbi:MAG: hypothetical protein DHS20C10_05690 [marine bacterium B5-7]|nr:MAG: hypothetical protein DHS20C10_05690 [marine bacterium B5-7]